MGYRCEQIEGVSSSCVCQTPVSGKVVNITGLASYDGTPRLVSSCSAAVPSDVCFFPRFTGLVEDVVYKIYDYNPCIGFSEGDCADVHVIANNKVSKFFSHYNIKDQLVLEMLIVGILSISHSYSFVHPSYLISFIVLILDNQCSFLRPVPKNNFWP